MGYQKVLFIASGDDNADGAALARLCRALMEASEKIYLLYIDEHHVTGFGTMTASHHIANDMQIKQEIFPRLKRICDSLCIPTDHIAIRFGNRARVIEQFVQERGVEMLAISCLLASDTRLMKRFSPLLEACQCDLHVMP
jgi:hypothetical protein